MVRAYTLRSSSRGQAYRSVFASMQNFFLLELVGLLDASGIREALELVVSERPLGSLKLSSFYGEKCDDGVEVDESSNQGRGMVLQVGF